MSQILYTRSKDGCEPVHLEETDGGCSYTLERPDGLVTFPSARQLVIAVTGHTEARHWTRDRYFRLGRFTPATRTQGAPILEALGPGGWAIDTSLTTPSGVVPVRRTGRRPPRRPDGLGIDLEARGREVAKLLFAGFGGMIRSQHYDPEDVLQEVFKGVLIRNQGNCPFDPAKASFGHYVHMVCRCVLSNYHRRYQRARGVIQEGLPGYDEDGESTTIDTGDDQVADPKTRPMDALDTPRVADEFLPVLERHPKRLVAVPVLLHMLRGQDQGEIARELHLDKSLVTRTSGFLRDKLRTWYHTHIE